MIYEFPETNAPIRQGDIFGGLPRVEIPLKSLTVLSENDVNEVVSWNTIVEEGKNVKSYPETEPRE